MTDITERKREQVLVNPLTMGENIEQIDNVVSAIVADAVRQIENEATSALRQREVTRAVNTLFTIHGSMVAYTERVRLQPKMQDLYEVFLDAQEPLIVSQLRILNPGADNEQLLGLAKETVSDFRKPKGETQKVKKSKLS